MPGKLFSAALQHAQATREATPEAVRAHEEAYLQQHSVCELLRTVQRETHGARSSCRSAKPAGHARARPRGSLFGDATRVQITSKFASTFRF
jgi:hypothetical protein